MTNPSFVIKRSTVLNSCMRVPTCCPDRESFPACMYCSSSACMSCSNCSEGISYSLLSSPWPLIIHPASDLMLGLSPGSTSTIPPSSSSSSASGGLTTLVMGTGAGWGEVGRRLLTPAAGLTPGSMRGILGAGVGVVVRARLGPGC